jgi:secondary thiamine-phosphate synthase enzyme
MIISGNISLESKGNCDIIDITAEVQQRLSETDISDGTVTLFVSGSTAGITTIEFEPGLLSDFKKMWERNIPQDIPYEHDRAWGDGNGHSHVRASLLGASLVIPFSDRRLTLGTWQQIVVVDFDNRARSRQIVVQIMGQ